MSRITVIGGTGHAGSAIVAEAAGRGHQVTALSRSLPAEPVPGVTYLQGDATDEATLSQAIDGADVVASAYSARSPHAPSLRDFYRTAARVADTAGVPLYIVGGYSSLRPAPGADRFVTDLSDIPAELHAEIRDGAQLIIEDLPATPATLDWVFVSPALRFGARMPGERLGRYRLGDDVAVEPDGGGAISAADYALGFVDLIEKGDHHREQVNLGH
ncbi:NAD-dependent epimerase/dehydratase [Xylanimonas cellulosilytica DSM 15894]|uniref:NAD-dependent epimerase/dehydratase n=1 Tax=Xylanimonas cellulosilytica (strain DSM 15894 / JCM 12276 / CECT 5975 / KCTC 9989 / LMG 20990 / NBRC 107835 / XIL07) TaxID=446471 RepID=D1BUT6_XYLCX|nr:NAD(P)H-binding protein [Xylanimonas cellulosilytica]ACZ29327.1 NAD-dependent epimerase/dehydratase [Xylanimonas cellulosilytica DSM 15894]